jgi:hypothetical protein
MATSRQASRLHRFPFALRRLRNYMAAYHECLEQYQIDPASGMLSRKQARGA